MSVTSSQDQFKIAELEATNRKLSAMLVEKDIIIEQLQQMISRNENNPPRPIGGGNRSLKSLVQECAVILSKTRCMVVIGELNFQRQQKPVEPGMQDNGTTLGTHIMNMHYRINKARTQNGRVSLQDNPDAKILRYSQQIHKYKIDKGLADFTGRKGRTNVGCSSLEGTTLYPEK